MEILKTRNKIVALFDSSEELMNQAMNPADRSKARYWMEERDWDWVGLDYVRPRGTVVEACEYLSSGWKEGAEKLSGLIESVDAPPSLSRKRRRVWGDDGDEVCPDRLRAGQFDRAYSRMRAAQVRGPSAVCIYVDALASAWVGAETMFWRGAAAVALADALIRSGYAVKLVSSWKGGSTSTGNKTILHCTTKDYRSPFDVTTAAAATACPAFFRFVGHLWGAGHTPKGFNDGAGYSVHELSESDLPVNGNEKAVLAHQKIENEKMAKQWMKKQMERIQETSP